MFNFITHDVGGWLEGIWNQKRKHVFALRFAESLIEKDESLNSVTTEEDQINEEEQEMGGEKKKGENEFSAEGQTSENTSEAREIEIRSPLRSSLTTKKESPLFTATRRGIEKIVRLIIILHHLAIEKLNKEGQSILDVAVTYRQKKIFDFVKQQKIPFARLHRIVDSKGNTLLHRVAEKGKNSGVTKPGPALQLQDELQWFEVSPFHPFVFT
jgi:hypothetical protein